MLIAGFRGGRLVLKAEASGNVLFTIKVIKYTGGASDTLGLEGPQGLAQVSQDEDNAHGEAERSREKG